MWALALLHWSLLHSISVQGDNQAMRDPGYQKPFADEVPHATEDTMKAAIVDEVRMIFSPFSRS